MPVYTWINTYLEKWGSKNIQYDADLDSVIDIAAVPTIPRVATKIVAASNSKDTSRADYVCDGSEDELTIESALSDLPSGGGMVLLLEGTYYISDSIDIPKSFTVLTGVGWSTKLYLVDGSDCNVINVSGGDDNTFICNLQIDGNKDNQTAGYGISISGSALNKNNLSGVLLCYIHHCYGYGINLNYANRGLIFGNQLQYNNMGLRIVNGDAYRIIANRCMNSADSGIFLSAANECNLIGNTCNSNGGDGIELAGADYSIIIGNRANNNSGYGLSIDANSDNNLVGKNYLSGNTTGSINDSGVGTILGVADTTNNIDNVV